MVSATLLSTSLIEFLCILHCCLASLEVHYVTPALLELSTITLVQRVAQVVHQVCLLNCGLNSVLL